MTRLRGWVILMNSMPEDTTENCLVNSDNL